MDISTILGKSPAELEKLPLGTRRKFLEVLLREELVAKQQNPILFYQSASSEAKLIHLSTAPQILAVGGNRSSKTESALAEMVIQMTGIVPFSLEAEYPQAKLRMPIRARLVVKSLTNTWFPVVLPKLQWWQWNGRGTPGGPFGHWGWIPQEMLIKGSWTDSWSEKHRTLTLTNGSTLQIMSHENDVTDFSGGSFHIIVIDEGIDSSRYRENLLRTMDVKGQLIMAMTPPDDEAAAWDAAWTYDQLYEKGIPGPNKDNNIDAFTLFTESNRILDKEQIASVSRGLTQAQREVRLHGRYLHLSGRIFNTFTDRPRHWCFRCNDLVFGGVCEHGPERVEFCHVIEPRADLYHWPIIYALDPHPRKPHAMLWLAIDPADDWWQIGELEVDGEPEVVRDKVFAWEAKHGLHIAKRLIDPNMAKSPAHAAGRRGITVRDEFDAVGLRCDLADDNRTTAIARVKAMLKPEFRTRDTRYHVFRSCAGTIQQMNRYSWQEWTRYSSDMKDPKPVPMDKYSDFPTLLGYIANSNPTYARLMMGQQTRIHVGKRRGAY